ncbi:MAG: T9SS type A sorting domain-containing protein [Bacteroidetes bacterium]|nr:MAG: T9SS type A sorting domain-containing protein [Bacteroidota bacterium]
MKTLLLSVLAAAVLQTLDAQNYLAFASGNPPHYSTTENDRPEAAEPAVAAFSHTIDDVALISLGKGFREKANLQVITPSADMLINQEVPAGQTRIRLDLSGLENGTYTIRIKVKDNVWVKQVIKE